MAFFSVIPSGLFASLFTLQARRQLKEMYVFSILFSFAFSLVSVFEPVFLYQQGFSLSMIAVYYAVHYTVYLVAMPWGAQFAAKFGLERSLTVSAPLFVVYFLALAALPRMPELFWLLPLLLTIHKIFYWPAYHANLAKNTDSSDRGTQVSWMAAITSGVGILAPLVGGFVAQWFGFSVLFVIAALVMLVAGVPLLSTKERFRAVKLPYTAGWQVMQQRKHRGMVLAMIALGEQLIDMVFWPIFLFIVFQSPERLGVVASVATVVMTLAGFVVGELGDRYGLRRTLRWSVPILVASFLVRPFAVTPLRALFTDIFTETSLAANKIPLVARLYQLGKRSSPLRYALAFESALVLNKAVLCWLLAGMFLVLPGIPGLAATFWIAAGLTLFYLFL